MTVACGLWPAVPADRPAGRPSLTGPDSATGRGRSIPWPGTPNLVFSAVDSSARPNDGWPSRSAANDLMSPSGTKRTFPSRRSMSALGVRADNICSMRAFRLLTHLGLSRPSISALQKVHAITSSAAAEHSGGTRDGAINLTSPEFRRRSFRPPWSSATECRKCCPPRR
jgi:hypothetical protein